jgi:hypothetical protein
MVDLPRYVHAEKKPDGRRYFTYQRYRGTPRAWPRVSLPTDPLSIEFATRAELCKRLEATDGPNGWTWSVVDQVGRKHDLPSPTDTAVFWAAVEKAEETGRQLAAGERKTFSALIVEFKDSASFRLKGAVALTSDAEAADGAPKKRRRGIKKSTQGLSKSTREQYARHFRDIEAAWGNDPVRKLTTEDAQKAIDVFLDDDIPAAGRAFRAALSRLIDWGIPRGYCETNVVEKTEKPADGGTYEPWPPQAFELFFEHARVDIHLPVYSALFTGQRKVDVLNMLRPRDDASEMPIIAQKTSARIPVQVHSEYRKIINASPNGEDKVTKKPPQLRLHLRADGEPWTYEGFKTAWGREMEKKELALLQANGWTFHGLRKNAVCMLLEVGCSEDQVGAIVGMSAAMVRHYAKEVSKFRLARSAMKLLESGWESQRVHVLGNVKAAQ